MKNKFLQEFFQEKTSKELDQKIQEMAKLKLDSLSQESSSSFLVKSKLLIPGLFVILFSVMLLSSTKTNPYYFSKNDIKELQNSPIETLTELQLDLLQDKELIEKDLFILVHGDYENI